MCFSGKRRALAVENEAAQGKGLDQGGKKIEEKEGGAQNRMRVENGEGKPDCAEREAYKQTFLCIYDLFLFFL